MNLQPEIRIEHLRFISEQLLSEDLDEHDRLTYQETFARYVTPELVLFLLGEKR